MQIFIANIRRVKNLKWDLIPRLIKLLPHIDRLDRIQLAIDSNVDNSKLFASFVE